MCSPNVVTRRSRSSLRRLRGTREPVFAARLAAIFVHAAFSREVGIAPAQYRRKASENTAAQSTTEAFTGASSR
jgi:hypothetical protein